MACILLSIPASHSQTTFSWRNDQSPGNNASWTSTSPYYFWNGSAGAVPGGAEILFFDGSAGTTMTNNLSATNRFKITFGNTNSPAARVINGSTENTFFEFGSTWPWIKNDATNIKHTINFPVKASSNSGFNLELIANAGALELSNTVNNNGRTIQVYGNNSSTDATNRYIRISGVLSGTGILNVSQFGVAKLNTAHTYTGETQINNGEIHIESSGSIASGSAIYVGHGSQLTNSTKLWLSNTTGGTTFSNNITVNNGDYQKRYLGGLNTSGTHTFSGTVAYGNTGQLSLSALSSGGTTEFTNTISSAGTGQVTIEGAGTVILSGGNTYTGLTYINAGNLRLNKSGGTTLPTGNNVTLDNAGTLRVSTNQTLNNLTLTNGNVTVDDNVTLTINGTLTLTSGKITLGTGNVVAAAISGGSSSSYVVTGGTGTLTKNSITSSTLIPVGPTASAYNPVTIASGGGSNYSVLVNTTAPTGGGITQATKVLSRQWDITPTTPNNPAGVSLTFQYNTGEGVSGGTFAPAASMDGIHLLSGTWANIGTVTPTAIGGGSYTVAFTYAGSAWSPFSMGNAGVLAAEILNISAIRLDAKNNIGWQTASEKDNAAFNIQRSTNNQTWQTIGSVKATNSANGAKYNFTDEAPLSTINYYRLQMVDNSGKMDYSKVVSLSGKEGKQALSVYPNPVKSELTVLTDGNTDGVSIFDMTGKIVRQFNDNRTKVNVSDLPNGIYFLRLLDKNGLAGEAVRFVKQ